MPRTRKRLTESREHCRVTYYGENGTGKTTAAAHMAHEGEVAVVAAEPGFRHRRLAELGIPVDRLQLALSTVDPDVPDVTGDHLDGLFYDLRQEYLNGSPDAPIGLLIDTWTEAQVVVTDEVRREELARARRKATDAEPWDQSDYFVDVGWHGIVTTRMNLYLRQFRDLPCHWAIVCQQERREPFRGKGSTSIGPANSPSVQRDVMGYSDFVIQLETMDNEADLKNPWRVGWTVPHGIAKAKDRDGILPARMAFPTFDRVLAYYRGELTVETDPLQQELDELLRLDALRPTEAKPRRIRASELARQGGNQ